MMDPPCLTCRVRKKACDRAKPQCKTCIKANRRCGGYVSRENTVFVNLNPRSIAKPLKPIIGKAITSAKQAKEISVMRHDNDYTVSLRILDLSLGDFQNHFTVLWTKFHDKYGRTPDVWSAGVAKLGLQNRALDMALISLATMRMSISESSNEYRIFSLSAYSASLQMFRRLLQDSKKGRCHSHLVVTSLIFTLFEGAQQAPTKIYNSGWAGHLKGTLALMQGQPPESFRGAGLLSVFRRTREMAIHFALSNRVSIFLARPEWMSLPWGEITKTPRDQLHDIAVNMTTVYAFLPEISKVVFSDETKITKIQVICRQLGAQLMKWQATHVKMDIFNSWENCSGESLDKEIDIFYPFQDSFPKEEYTFLVAEFAAMSLLLVLAELKILQKASLLSPEDLDGKKAQKLEELSRKCGFLEGKLREVLCLPCFGQAISELPGLTEGRCRSLLPTWALAQCSPIAENGQIDWWDSLALRLIYGIG
ncbi:Transcriptional regulatory protein moc3 [Talaromyces islandicus]|uniref:Transcriptional regulatory protein moc3 n=1 Tax=Talaromyces islandicus TaxID=28573 RepID=A0A0U1LKP8_TALIS|nr:Transcriptional regulatory protein moc3 [Talaromyces islandicus]